MRPAATVLTATQFWSDLGSQAWRYGNAATDPAEALRWLQRAQRILPNDDMVALSLALAQLRAGNPRDAAALFAAIATRLDLLEAWTGLAASERQAGRFVAAAAAMQAALSRHAIPHHLHPLANAVAGPDGWCAIDPAGRLHASKPANLCLDGQPITPRWSRAGCRIPAGARLEASREGTPLLGSPIDLRAIGTCEGFVTSEAGDLVGWAWYPRNPDANPTLTIAGRSVTAREPMDATELARPLARPRRFRLSRADLPPGLVEVAGPDGCPLLGSPINPGMEQRSAAGLEARFTPIWADNVGPAATTAPKRPPVDVVVPVYATSQASISATLACLRRALASLPRGSRLHVVDDASPEPAIAPALASLASDRRVNLIRLDRNRGFPSAANAGLRAAAGRDVALLNSDAYVPPGWLAALADAAHSAPDIASACPLSNEATILSYPNATSGNPVVDPDPVAALARRVNGTATVDIPVGVGFCMLIRRDCLDAVGLFREDLFAQGYGEENDWCLRARHRGWRHVAVPGCFVAHDGGASFGPARRHLLERNGATLERLHPGYGALVAAWIAQDPLAPARARLDTARWRQGRCRSAVALVTHDSGGGVERVIAARITALRGAGVRPVVLRPADGAVVVGDGDTPNLRFRLPEDWPGLLRLLRGDRVQQVELHHTLGHPPEIMQLGERLDVPQSVFVHDYAWFCPRIALVPEHAYCGEPPVSTCEACVADHGSNLDEPITPTALVERSTEVLLAASTITVPSADVAARMRRHFPQVQPVVEPWEDDTAIPPPPSPALAGNPRHVLVPGGIGVEKGFEVVLACVRDAAARGLALRFTVAGSTTDDERLLAAGPVFITGRYQEAEGEALLRAQGADLAWVPSIWPETWCFTLGLAWRAGLWAAVFGLGTQAARVRRTGWGWVLPLGLPPAALNDWLLRPPSASAADARPLPAPAESAFPPSPLAAIPANGPL